MSTLNEWVAMLGKIGTAGLRQAIRRTAIASALDAEGKAKERLSGEVLSARTGHLRRSIAGSVRESGDLTDIVLGAGGRVGDGNVKYARIHEFGGTTHPKVTGKMRGFAWFKFRETQDPMWRAIALTRKPRLNVPVPARHYVSLAIEATRERMPRLVEQSIRFVAKKEGLA